MGLTPSRVVETSNRTWVECVTPARTASPASYRGTVPRPLRTQVPGGIYHLASRGNRRAPIYLDDLDRQFFLTLFGTVLSACEWRCYGFCLMTTHYHLLVMTPQPNLAHGMQLLNGMYAQRFNRRHAEVGHLFRGRYHSTLVEREGHLLELSRYIALNPVRAGLCDTAGEWKWSSHRAMVGLARVPKFLTVSPILELFAASEETARERFARFVDGA
jgi:putative transposase